MIDDGYTHGVVWLYILDKIDVAWALFPEREECNWTYTQLMERTIAFPLDYRIVTLCSN